jgi:hypothetical protein
MLFLNMVYLTVAHAFYSSPLHLLEKEVLVVDVAEGEVALSALLPDADDVARVSADQGRVWDLKGN